MARIAQAFGGQVIRLSGRSVRGGSVSGNIMRRGANTVGSRAEVPLGAIIPKPRSSFFFPADERDQTVGFDLERDGDDMEAAPPRFRLAPSGTIFRRNQIGQPDQGR